ncbi:tetratricopeptide repeat protein [Scytonema sp. PCC 10023]|uniref:tetratricopeptide repeat protein n=1 Tax=Scytonema sp. PCC 10023 TaxID=1680591 RepID=UPI0039C5CAA8
MTEEDRSAKVGGSADRSAIITGNSNTATITITNYYYRENTTVRPVESTVVSSENLLCPYRGLFHFGPDDAEFFFGREVFVEELFAATQNRNFIPVLGASGSGKSSVVLAGLVPKLQNEGHWLFTHFRPGSEPFHALALALVPLYTENLDATDKIIQARKLSQSLGDGEISLADVFAQIHQNHPTARVLLIADQFEEIYTLCADHKVRHSFLDSLLVSFQSSAYQSQYNHVLVATMRADFLGNALSYPAFGDVLKTDIKLRSMNHDELSQVIAKPAEKLGVTFEGGLVERILDDVEDEPGNLPLLEFALTELWNQRQGKQLTHAAYQHIGKVQGALARHADQNYGKLSAAQKEQVRRIFIQLVQPGEDRQDTRRVATKAELGEERWKLVKQLADDRLVVTSQNAANQETVEVVHEALIRNWEELRQWMNADRSFRAWQERLRFAMLQWQKMQRDEGALLRGAVLKEAEEKLKQRREELSAGEQEFIQASVALRQRGQQRIYYFLGGIGSVLSLVLGIWGWLNYTSLGQLTQIRWQLTDVSQRTEPRYQSEAAIAFAKDENSAQALKLANQIHDSYYKASALSAIAAVYGKLNQPEKVAPLLEKAITSANQIQAVGYKASALSAIAAVYGKLNQPEKAAPLLEKAIASANQVGRPNDKLLPLIAIVKAIAELQQTEKASALLEKAITVAKQIPRSANAIKAIAEVYVELQQPEKASALLEKAIADDYQNNDSSDKADALRAIAEAIDKLNQPEKAAPLLEKAIASANQIQISGDFIYIDAPANQADALRAIAQAYGKLKQRSKAAALLEKAIASANQIQDSNSKAYTLSAIAQAYGKLNQPEKAAALLEKAIASANQIQDSDNQDSYNKANNLSAIAQAIVELQQPEKAAALLEKAIASANQIQESRDKANALSAIAQAYAELQQPQTASALLEKAITSVNQIQESFEVSKDSPLRAITKAIGKLNQPEIAGDLLKQAIASANNIQESYSNASALSAIAEAAANLKNWGQALKATQECPSDDCKVESLAKVLTVHAEQQHPELKEEEEEEETFF